MLSIDACVSVVSPAERGAMNVSLVLGGAFCGYVFASALLFKYPSLLHVTKRLKFKCKHISHRGGAAEGYENTMMAFRRVVRMGTDMLELDVHLTKDGQVVVLHDSNLLRVTGVYGEISNMDFADLPVLRNEIPIQFDPDHVFIGSGSEIDRKIILLEDVFTQFPEVPINIDIKVDNDDLIEKVNNLIIRYGREEYTVWGNFKDTITSKCYKKNPRVNLFFSMKRVLHLILLFYTGLLPFFTFKETHLEICLPSIYMRITNQSNASFLPFHILIRVMNIFSMKKMLFRHLEKRGIQTYLWVLNNEFEFKEAFDVGVTGVMTDHPTRLKKFLLLNPCYEWRPSIYPTTT